MSYPTIKLGYDGPATQTLRAALEAVGLRPNYSVLKPSLFDSWVDAAVRTYQKARGLLIDGVVGPKTWAALLNRPDLATGPGPEVEPANLTTGEGAQPSPSGSSFVPLLLGAGAIALGFIYFRSRRKSLDGIVDDARAVRDEQPPDDVKRLLGKRAKDLPPTELALKEAWQKARAKRMAWAREVEADFTEQYQRELKRTGIDPERQPGWAKDVAARVQRAMDTEAKVYDRGSGAPEDLTATEWRKMQQETILKRVSDEARDAAREAGLPEAEVKAAAHAATQRWLRKEGGKAAPGPGTYRQEVARGAGSIRTQTKLEKRGVAVSPGTSLRLRTEEEDRKWLERVESSKPAAQALKKVYVTSKRYHTDRKYRESEQASARELAEKTRSQVQLVNERGVPLYNYLPNVRALKGFAGAKRKKLGDFRDVTSERLIQNVITDSLQNCPKAVRGLFKVRALVTDAKTAKLFARAQDAVQKRCTSDVGEEITEREAIRAEIDPRARLEEAERRYTKALKDAGLFAEGKRATDFKFTTKAISRMIERGIVSKEDGADLLVRSRDYERARKIADEALSAEGRAPSIRRVYRLRRSGWPTQEVSTLPGGRKRSKYVR